MIGLREIHRKLPYSCLSETIWLKFQQMKSTMNPRTNFVSLACKICTEIQRGCETALGPFLRGRCHADHESGCLWEQGSMIWTLPQAYTPAVSRHTKHIRSIKTQINHEKCGLYLLEPNTKWVTLAISNSEVLQSRRTEKTDERKWDCSLVKF